MLFKSYPGRLRLLLVGKRKGGNRDNDKRKGGRFQSYWGLAEGRRAHEGRACTKVGVGFS